MNKTSEYMLFFVILFSNLLFFAFVFYYMAVEFRKMLMRKKEKVFIFLCYCCRKERFKQKKDEMMAEFKFNERNQNIINSKYY